ncbi:PLDc N-terminal domain-containing protein [Marinoscillum sp.]|uniref:PLDc N-terminal domain-containing protein n=1 Tax=Marinoscillum sp. TaxID=2024838 RepID=UPI003BAC939F
MTAGYIIALVCAIWVIYDVVSNQKSMSGGSKLLWIICALIFNVITAIVYFFVVKR